jgi:hypothetical protein
MRRRELLSLVVAGVMGCSSPSSTTAAVKEPEQLPLPPAASSSPTDGAAEPRPVSEQRLRQYVRALNELAEVDSAVAAAVGQGLLVDVDAFESDQEAEQAIRRAGLSREEVREITERLQRDPALRQRYQQIVKQTAQQPAPAVPPPRRP